jgi:hypothetical protein
LVRQDGVTVKEVAGVSGSLLWFAGGVAAAVWALTLIYFTKYCYVGAETSKVFTFDHPYINDTANTRRWLYWGYAFHLGVIACALLSLAAFVVGMIDVHRAILRLGS